MCVPVNHHTSANKKQGALVSLTWTGAGGVLAEVLSREQERDLQGSEGQEAALVGKIQEVKTCEGSGNAFVTAEPVRYVKRRWGSHDPSFVPGTVLANCRSLWMWGDARSVSPSSVYDHSNN